MNQPMIAPKIISEFVIGNTRYYESSEGKKFEADIYDLKFKAPKLVVLSKDEAKLKEREERQLMQISNGRGDSVKMFNGSYSIQLNAIIKCIIDNKINQPWLASKTGIKATTLNNKLTGRGAYRFQVDEEMAIKRVLEQLANSILKAIGK